MTIMSVDKAIDMEAILEFHAMCCKILITTLKPEEEAHQTWSFTGPRRVYHLDKMVSVGVLNENNVLLADVVIVGYICGSYCTSSSCTI